MDISKFFNVLVVTGASATVGVAALVACGSSDDSSSGGSAGTSASSGGRPAASAGSGGASGGTAGSSAACNLQPSACNAAYLDDENANGCCCWISAAKGPGVCPEGACPASDTCCA